MLQSLQSTFTGNCSQPNVLRSTALELQPMHVCHCSVRHDTYVLFSGSQGFVTLFSCS